MSLREDLDKIAEEEGFQTAGAFLQVFLESNNQTYMDLKDFLEKKYRRYYSWIWVYVYCREMVPGYYVSRRNRVSDKSGINSQLVKKYWQDRCVAIGYDSLDEAFECWDSSLRELSRYMNVNYNTLHTRYQKWMIAKGKE